MALGAGAMALTGTSQIAMSAGQDYDGIAEFSLAESAPLDPTMRTNANYLSASEQLIEAMIEEEGVRYDVYRDVAGYPTVGVGHLVLPEDNLSVGDRISHKRAVQLLEQDLGKAEQIVQRLVGNLPINQHEFDALVDLAFNVGAGTLSERNSPKLNEAIQNADYEAIADELNYTTAAGRVARGLIHRSDRREQIFLENDYSDPREA